MMIAGTRFIEGLGLTLPERLPMGAVLGSAKLVGWRYASHCEGDPWAFGPICWEFAEPRACKPIEVAGKLGVWHADEALRRALARVEWVEAGQESPHPGPLPVGEGEGRQGHFW
jgi:hypothetical protein